jgi:hypothetical protein
MARSGFTMGRLDHVHIRVGDRALAARWHADHLEPVERFDVRASGFDGGPPRELFDAYRGADPA